MKSSKLSRQEIEQIYIESVVDDDELIEITEACYNQDYYGYYMSDKELDFRINRFMDLKRNYTFAGNEEIELPFAIEDEMEEDFEGKKYFMSCYRTGRRGFGLRRDYLVQRSEINLEEIVKLNLIKNAPNIATKMKLLEPKIYNIARDFYLSLES